MPNWGEIIDQWQIIEDRDGGQAATRVYYDKASSSGSLPLMDSSLGPGYPNLFLKTRVFTKRPYSTSDDTTYATLTYTPRSQDAPSPNTSFDDLPRSFQIGGEMLTFDEGGGWYWDSDGAAINDRVFKRVVTGTLQVTEVITSSQYTVATSKIITNAGRVNDATFESIPEGRWLYMGANMDAGRDGDGNEIWTVQHTFAYRNIDGVNSSDWMHGWRKSNSTWDVIQNTAGTGGDRIYRSVSFSNIFTAAGA